MKRDTGTITCFYAISCLFLFFSASALFSSCRTHHWNFIKNNVLNGTADLSQLQLTDRTIARLNGNWYFWQDELLSNDDIQQRLADKQTAAVYQQVPGNWSDVRVFKNIDTLSRCGTLAIQVTFPVPDTDWMMRLPDANAACAFFADSESIAAIGTAELSDAYCPGKGLEYARFHVKGTSALIILHVVNNSLPYTGTWSSPTIGTPNAIGAMQRLSLIRESLICGAMLSIGLYHLFLFLLRRMDRSTLFFALICVFMTIRCLIMGERILMQLFSPTPESWRLSFVIEHLSAHMCMPLFCLFLQKIYPKDIRRLPFIVILCISALWLLLEICTPQIVHHRFLSVFEYIIFATTLYAVAVVILAAAQKRSGAPLTLIGLSVMACTIVNDVLLSNEVIQSVYMTSYGLVFFTFVQSFFLARRSSRLFVTIERYVVELKLLNKSLERFIPREMLSYLNKKSIADVRLGDYSDQAMTVFFLDIRNFTSLSELLPSETTFKFLNTFLGVFGPIIRKHGGFIDKYLGDGFMALFPAAPDDAIEAALEMRKQRDLFNAENNRDIDFGIGIHTGSLTLGTIGESQRMDSTVISDTVNTASRLEQLNKTLGNGILVSLQTIEKLKNADAFSFFKVGEEKVKGKEKLLNVYRVLPD